MRKIIVLLFIVIGFKSYGQDNKFLIGFEAGAGMSKGKATDDSSGIALNSTAGIGIYAGLLAEYRFNENFSLRTGLAFEQKRFGQKEDISFSFFGTSFNYSFEMDAKFNYLTIPLNFTAGFGEKVRVFIGAGPYASFLLSQSTTTTTSGTGIPTETVTSDDKDNFKSTDFGLSFVGGLGIPIGDKAEFSFTVRDNLGLSNIENDPTVEMTMKFNAIYGLLGLGYKF